MRGKIIRNFDWIDDEITWERLRGRPWLFHNAIMVIARRRVVRPRAYRLAVSISKGDRFLSFTGVCRGTLARSARQPGRWISMGYAKYFVFPITSTSLTHCTPGITIVYTTVRAIGLPGGWHRESQAVTTFAATLQYFSSIYYYRITFPLSFLFSKQASSMIRSWTFSNDKFESISSENFLKSQNFSEVLERNTTLGSGEAREHP